MSELDADRHRYRALLKDADDEPKRLALIQLLIEEGAKAKLAAQQKPAAAERLPQSPPFISPARTPRELPSQDAVSAQDTVSANERQGLEETPLLQAAEVASVRFSDLAARLKAHEPERLPQSPPFIPPARTPRELPSQDAVSAQDTVSANERQGLEETPLLQAAEVASVRFSDLAARPKTHAPEPPSIRSEPTSPNDLIDEIAKLLGSRVALAKTAPAAMAPSPSHLPPSGNDIEDPIASQIRAALEKRDRQ